ncbi:cupin domain-containing protein [Amycolatopsis sp. NPDC001319]|uniref:cupin domain-containing protein n=2 Tax=Amycolatopsis TaxID=1813 RepID=UPI0036770C5F
MGALTIPSICDRHRCTISARGTVTGRGSRCRLASRPPEAPERTMDDGLTFHHSRMTDALSRLIRLAHLHGSVDLRCLMAGQFMVDHEAAEPGQVPFYLVLDGRCAVTTDSATVTLSTGDLLLVSRGEAHQVTAPSGRKFRFSDESGPMFTTRRTVGVKPDLDLFCGHYHFDTAAGELLFRLLPALVHVTPDTAATTLADLLRDEARFAGPGSAAVVSALCDAMLAMGLRSRPEQRLDTPALWTALGDEALGKVVSGIVERPGDSWTIERMAETASMSRSTFLRRFTARTGTTAATLLTTIRMMVAADLLTNSDRSMSRIAGDVGYSSESAFSQAFRATVGLSPAQYRKNAVHHE